MASSSYLVCYTHFYVVTSGRLVGIAGLSPVQRRYPGPPDRRYIADVACTAICGIWFVSHFTSVSVCVSARGAWAVRAATKAGALGIWPWSTARRARCSTAVPWMLEGGFRDKTMAVGPLYTSSSATRSRMLHIRAKDTAAAPGGLMGDLRWSFGALSGHAHREVLRWMTWIRAADRIFGGTYRYRRCIVNLSSISQALRSARYRQHIDDISTIFQLNAKVLLVWHGCVCKGPMGPGPKGSHVNLGIRKHNTTNPMQHFRLTSLRVHSKGPWDTPGRAASGDEWMAVVQELT